MSREVELAKIIASDLWYHVENRELFQRLGAIFLGTGLMVDESADLLDEIKDAVIGEYLAGQ